MTAANIYNYYAGKDEINIAIRLRAGSRLYRGLLAAWETDRPLPDRIWDMMLAYLRFGLRKPSYYAIMFDMPTPKYAHYVGTPLEALARREKESSEQSVALMVQCTRALQAGGFHIPEAPELFMTQIWGQLHGLVSLYNNHLLAEMVSEPNRPLKRRQGPPMRPCFGRFPNRL